MSAVSRSSSGSDARCHTLVDGLRSLHFALTFYLMGYDHRTLKIQEYYRVAIYKGYF